MNDGNEYEAKENPVCYPWSVAFWAQQCRPASTWETVFAVHLR
jgi:hypothetical protein